MIARGKKNGTITIVCNSFPSAKRVFLTGDFNKWDPTDKRMVKNKNGSFRARVQLFPGEYQYKFFADGLWLHDPDAHRQVVNPYGTLNSVVTVN